MKSRATPVGNADWSAPFTLYGLDLSASASPERLSTLTTFLLLSEAVQAMFWAWLPPRDTGRPEGWLPTAIAIAAICVLGAGLRASWLRMAAGAMAALVWLRIAVYFPMAPNHTYLGAFCLTTLAYVGIESAAQRQLACSMLGWLALCVLFSTGVQKVINGLYLRGQFLAFAYRQAERMRPFLNLLLSAEDRHALLAIGEPAAGVGPFRFTAWPALVASNLIWLAELLMPIGLLLHKTRAIAAWLCLGLFLGIATSTRELTFGLLFLNLLSLFIRKDLSAVWLPVAASIFGYMFATRLGFVPYWQFN